jgi:hypothetical protein
MFQDSLGRDKERLTTYNKPNVYRGQIDDSATAGTDSMLPKKTNPKYVEDYRLLTLLYTDYKILARFIANRLRLCITEILHPNQYCGLQGNTAFDAVAAIREAVAVAEVTRTPLGIVSIDFSAAFDNISHS